MRASQLMHACRPSLVLCLGALLPAAAWALVTGVTLDNYIAFAIGGTLATALCWLAMLRLTRHPLLDELRPLWCRIAHRQPAAER